MSQRTVEDDALLDAARACVLAVGVRRTTVTDVARRAGVSRMTLYRRYPDISSLISALMTREFSALGEEVKRIAAKLPNARARLVEEAVLGADRLTRNPLFLRIVDVDPELLLPYVTTRLGSFQQLVVADFEQQVRDGVADRSVEASDPVIVARSIELALRGFVLQTLAEGAEAAREPELAELRRLLDRYLAP
ncbi:TetR/AcrR family transcriptional regulator [Conexibacter sp. JD483]|uniref:TetR/AcrR family transcriptional regulator n=1 Tax=unclassified Conexibacter TaxID=2627773 RepID=UPI00271660A3|nr:MULTISPECIES: TetR/AcrR family transcriptional regulator [unclassified Conexibacter]MDO8184106.1 TetR/AcrR family transcriptional regulator [Conexibacter sp. CPCC 205706]MDO8197098.1 TetR/AcrR family transcriptional regulator [Conexibacter sp. CPCC 205762]MDR9367587.1 TetR/AcrR family transcriptional regulator [Conexibacter sp. JD483]